MTTPASPDPSAAVTSAPSAFAICTANDPTPPEAPVISTVCPAVNRATSRSACSAVIPDVGTAAASAAATPAGTGAR